ncbi:MAG: hypothetical protein NVSMB2_21200 [Chloroflexota bacterium]
MKLAGLISLISTAVTIAGGATALDVPFAATVLGQPVPVPPGMAQLFSNPGEWMATVVNAVLVSVAHRTTADAVEFMNWVLGSGNVISQTPPGLSYANDAVVRLSNTVRIAAYSGLALVTAVGGINLILHPHIRAPYHGALELIPRVILSAILIRWSLEWGGLVIDANNALCGALGSTSIASWNVALDPAGGAILVNLIAMGVYALMGLLLLLQMLMRLALLDALLVIAPLALLCWVLPQTYSWARLWFTTFFGTVFVQALQVLVLQLGGQLIAGLPHLLPSLASDPANTGRVWLVTIMLAIAVLQLTRKIPNIMPGHPGNTVTGGPSVGTVRAMAALVRGGGRGGR